MLLYFSINAYYWEGRGREQRREREKEKTRILSSNQFFRTKESKVLDVNVPCIGVG